MHSTSVSLFDPYGLFYLYILDDVDLPVQSCQAGRPHMHSSQHPPPRRELLGRPSCRRCVVLSSVLRLTSRA